MNVLAQDSLSEADIPDILSFCSELFEDNMSARFLPQQASISHRESRPFRASGQVQFYRSDDGGSRSSLSDRGCHSEQPLLACTSHKTHAIS